MSIALIFDCGATNLRTIAMNNRGQILASFHLPNNTQPDPINPDYHIWDIDEIWQKLLTCAELTLSQLKAKNLLSEVKGIGVTTFGVDGAPFDREGKQLYPIISWKCPRTVPIMQGLSQLTDIKALYERNGIGQYSFNTLFKLLWLKQNEPDVYRKMDQWVFISSMISQRLTGEWSTDRTMAGTSMTTNLADNDWDTDVLAMLGLNKSHFPPMKSAGEQIGMLKADLADQFGLESIPVISCGHDTQFAVFGSGADINQPVLSSGTWEILMVRTPNAQPYWEFVPNGLTTEFDAQTNLVNPAVQWVGSGVLEWVGKLLFADVVGTDGYYPTMIAEGRDQPVGSGGIQLQGVFSAADHHSGIGQITGLSMHTQRGQIYRASLEYMALQLKKGLAVLEQVGQFKARSLLCVGGGSKNGLWNQIRADVLNLPLDIVDVAESTVLGAAMFVLFGIGEFSSALQAQQAMRPQKQRIEPSKNAKKYENLYQNRGEN